MLQERYAINKKKIVFRRLDDVVVLLNVDNGYYYTMEGTGAEIFRAMERGKTVQEVIDFLKGKYKVSLDILKNDTLELVKDLKKEEIIIQK